MYHLLSHGYHIVKGLEPGHQPRRGRLGIVGQKQHRDFVVLGNVADHRHDLDFRRAAGRLDVDDPVEAVFGVFLCLPDVGRRGRPHFVLAVFLDAHVEVLFPGVIEVAVGDVHPSVHLDAHVREDLLEIEIGESVHHREVLADEPDLQRVRALVDRQAFKGLQAVFVARLDVPTGFCGAHVAVETLQRGLEAAGLGLKAAVHVVLTLHLVDVLDHVEGGAQRPHRLGRAHVGQIALTAFR